MPTPNLNMHSPYEVLFNQVPNDNHLHSFGCLCFPCLRPYTKHKLQAGSIPCIFIGYSSSQYAHLCLDPISNHVYSSRHVNFIENSFPYSSLTQPQSPSTSTPPLATNPHIFIPTTTTTTLPIDSPLTQPPLLDPPHTTITPDIVGVSDLVSSPSPEDSSELSTRFSLKYLGFPHYFLGIEIIPTKDGLFLSQHKYMRDLLEKVKMSGVKPNSTPLCFSTPLKLLDGYTAVDG
ncbi:hypothetical protein L6164_013152 [Bauhinia variegata]|uniref:Uncharacterized protein n=1 Tax=Bauhinia variegata TaxID=167791 RepID=A0ACB9PHN5_BAUVA|nr:hypothetical protein L6164_013152 [Bauhinia variegata]